MQLNIKKRTLGLNFNKSGVAEIWLWAPEAWGITLYIHTKDLHQPFEQSTMGYWYLSTDKIRIGDEYSIQYHKDDKSYKLYADPASLLQKDGVHNASTAFDLKSYHWNDSGWKGLSLKNFVIYELHTGTFSTSGTFQGIEDKLDYLTALGITAIEIMPIAQFAGERNWGYDGVFPFAVQNSYGGPEALMRLVDKCHSKGIAVILDVVYNHLGPEGAILDVFGAYHTDKYHTPWGAAMNFDDADCDGVREYFIENALMWFRDFHIDGLRLDAVHAIKDFSPKHILAEIREAVDKLSLQNGKVYHLIAELDLNDNKYISPLAKGGYGMHAQWIDEFHHALRVSCGQKPEGYYADFNGIEHLTKAFNDAYVYTGQYSPHRKKKFGIPTHNDGQQFIVFSQNHDQVGNRMLGERSSNLVNHNQLKLMATAVLCAPFIPFLFMGEEWAASTPFLYFVNHSDEDLLAAVRKGRKAEFAAFHNKEEVPDPASLETFQLSKLNWSERKEANHKQIFNFYQKLLKLRKSQPCLQPDRTGSQAEAFTDKSLILLQRNAKPGKMYCILNFSAQTQEITINEPLTGWKVLLDSNAVEFGGQQPFSSILNNNISISPQSAIIISN